MPKMTKQQSKFVREIVGDEVYEYALSGKHIVGTKGFMEVALPYGTWDTGHRTWENGRARLLPSQLSGTWERRHGTRKEIRLTERFALPNRFDAE